MKIHLDASPMSIESLCNMHLLLKMTFKRKI